MTELSIQKMETISGGSRQSQCLLAVGLGVAGVFGLGIGIVFPPVGAAIGLGIMIAGWAGYGGNPSYCD